MQDSKSINVEEHKLPKFYVEITCQAFGINSDDVFRARTDEIATCLFALDDAAGARFAATPITKQVVFGFSLERLTSRSALRFGRELARTAIHAAGGATPLWEVEFEEIDSSAVRGALVGAT